MPHASHTRAGRPRELVLVVNANASAVGGDRGPTAVRDLLVRHGARPEVVVTHSPAELEEVLAAHPHGRVVLAGGDGTVHTAAVGAAVDGPELALIPAGRANNLAHALGIPLELDAAARLAVEGAARPMDLIAVDAGGRRTIAVEGVSVGFLAQARARYHAANSAHPVAAAGAALAALAAFHPLDVRVSTGGEERVLHVAQLFVANLPLYLNGLPVAPGADPRDGLLDLVALAAPGRRAIPGMLWHLRRGTHLRRPDVMTRRVAALRLSTGGASPVIADSEDVGPGPVDIGVLPGAMRLVVPGG